MTQEGFKFEEGNEVTIVDKNDEKAGRGKVQKGSTLAMIIIMDYDTGFPREFDLQKYSVKKGAKK